MHRGLPYARHLLNASSKFSSSPHHDVPCQKRWLSAQRLGDFYTQEAFESLQRFKGSSTYPGSIRLCTPGDTSCYLTESKDILPDSRQRHYWRPVVDDPELATVVHLRVRFKERVWVAPRWETQMHVFVTTVPLDATVGEIITAIKSKNRSPYVMQRRFHLKTTSGKALRAEDAIEPYALDAARDFDNLGLTLDAVDDDLDHLWTKEEYTPKSWATDNVSPEEEVSEPLDELRLLNLYGTQGDTGQREREMPTQPRGTFPKAQPPASIGYRHFAVR